MTSTTGRTVRAVFRGPLGEVLLTVGQPGLVAWALTAARDSAGAR